MGISHKRSNSNPSIIEILFGCKAIAKEELNDTRKWIAGCQVVGLGSSSFYPFFFFFFFFFFEKIVHLDGHVKSLETVKV